MLFGRQIICDIMLLFFLKWYVCYTQSKTLIKSP